TMATPEVAGPKGKGTKLAVRAVIFDIGGVLEITPPTGWAQKWERILHLAPGGLAVRISDAARPNGAEPLTEPEVHRRLGEMLGLESPTVDALMQDAWTEYLGTLNVELVRYFRALRPRYRTALISNSFVGARERERGRYGLEEMADVVVYSHEVGRSKPQPENYLLTCQLLARRAWAAVLL